MHDKGIKQIIAFSGGASLVPIEFGEEVNRAMSDATAIFESSVIADALTRLRPYRNSLGIQTGGTKWGVPAVASRLAKQMGFFTIGIFPAAGADKALDEDVLDLRVCVDIRRDFDCSTPEDISKFRSDWGDESPHFCKTLDGVIVFGGRAGTLVEVAHVLKVNEWRKKHQLTPKYIVPILASGGMAEATPYLPANPEVRSWCMPDRVVRSGAEAAILLEDKLNLHDLLNDAQCGSHPTDPLREQIA
jgi:predicted Rossmann-fold nucleotide-binding protein